MNDTKTALPFGPYLKYVVIGLLLCSLPLMATFGIVKGSIVTIVGGVLIYSFAAMGLDILLGHSGLISLGTAGFMGMAAYTSAFLTENLKLPFIIAALISIGITVLLGLVVGAISLRVEGFYLAIATLCVSEILRKTFEELTVVTSGFAGKSASFPELFPGFRLDRSGMYIFIAVLLVVFMCIAHNIINSYIGRAFSTMRGSEVAAQAMGIDLIKYRLMSFALATFYSALAGVLYVHFIKFSYPSTWILPLSLNILAIIVIGGLRSIPGTLIGSFIVFGVPDLILKQLPVIGAIPGVAYIFNGLLIIVIILFYPNGAINIFANIRKKFVKKGDVAA